MNTYPELNAYLSHLFAAMRGEAIERTVTDVKRELDAAIGRLIALRCEAEFAHTAPERSPYYRGDRDEQRAYCDIETARQRVKALRLELRVLARESNAAPAAA